MTKTVEHLLAAENLATKAEDCLYSERSIDIDTELSNAYSKLSLAHSQLAIAYHMITK